MRGALSILAALACAGMLVSPASAAQAEDLQVMIDRAEPGSVLQLPPGTYAGGVTIGKPLELRGEGWPVVDGGGRGNVITITSPDVTVTGLVIANTGDSLDREDAGVSGQAARIRVVDNRFENVLFGVFLRQGDDSYVADNVIGAKKLDLARRGDGIRLWQSPRSIVERNQVDGGRDIVLWFSPDLVLRDNVVANGRYGIHFMYSDRVLLERNYLSGNSVGGFLMYSRDLVLKDNLITANRGPSGYGIGLKDIDGVEATGNRFISNRIGVYFDNSPATRGVEHHFTGNLFAYNDVGAAFLPSVSGNVFSGNAFVNNGEQVGVQGGGVFEGNVWTVGGVGNHWSDFAGYDADGDGIGDVPYRLADLFSTLTDAKPELHFFDETPASRAIDLAARMFPTFRPRPKVEDTAPLVQMPDFPSEVDGSSPGSPLTMALAGGGMLVLAVGLIAAARSPLRKAGE